jgi:hypothetical protein
VHQNLAQIGEVVADIERRHGRRAPLLAKV